MDINRTNLEALFSNYLAAWQEVLNGPNPLADVEFALTVFPSTTASNFYAWLDKVPGFRKWVGDRLYNNVRGQKFEVVNEDFEDSIRMDLDDLEDDQFGLYPPIVKMMARSWLELKRSQVIGVFTGNPTTFTGKALVADDHAYGEQTLDNLTASALSTSAFEAAHLAAAGWKYSNGELVNPRWTHLVVGPKLRSSAWHIVKDTKTYDATDKVQVDNPNYGRVELVVWPELTGTYDDYWFLVDASKPVRPVALQVRKEPQPLMDTDPATVQRNGYVDFLASGRLAAAPTFPHLVYGGIL